MHEETDLPAVQIGDFRPVRRLGRGASGTVYEAHQVSLRRHVALKVLHPQLIPANDEAIRFEREAWIGGRLSHPNILRVFMQGTEGGFRFIAMELVQGGSLEEVIRSSQSLSDDIPELLQPVSVAKLFAEVADALEQVHQLGIIHRDIKPSNLLFSDRRDRLMLTDFGIARDAQLSRLTQSGFAVGTVHYMSPEQLQAAHSRVDFRSDLWSLGVSLYEALTLKLPFDETTDEAYFYAVTSKSPIPPRKRRRSLSKDAEGVILKCLEAEPERRYSSARELKEDLLRLAEAQPVRARRADPAYQLRRFALKNRRVLAPALILAALLALMTPVLQWMVVTEAAVKESASRAQSYAFQAIALMEAAAKASPDDLATVLKTNDVLHALWMTVLTGTPSIINLVVADSTGRIMASGVPLDAGAAIRGESLDALERSNPVFQAIGLLEQPKLYQLTQPFSMADKGSGEVRVIVSTALLRDEVIYRTWVRYLPQSTQRWFRDLNRGN